MGCIEENTVAAFAEARLRPDDVARVEEHARSCTACHQMVVAALEMSGLDHSAATHRLGATHQGPVERREVLTAGKSVGRYTVLGLVGRGGMGEVYAAYDPDLDRRVALKLMRSGTGSRDGRGQERLLREAQSIAKLSHPNVVVVHDVGTFEGQVFMAMEFVDGVTLAAWVTQRERPWREILNVFLQAAHGLSAAHHAGLVHRDFKPQNVMVGRDDKVRVMDFGLARRINHAASPDPADVSPVSGSWRSAEVSVTRTGDILGTPLYMAPEQFTGGRIDARTDQFSFCVALFWALCGIHPFPGRPAGEIDAAPLASRKGVPAWVLKALVRGLSVNPDQRWPSMAELINALNRDSVRRRRAVLSTTVAALGLLAVGAGIARWSQQGPSFCLGGADRFAAVWEPPEKARPGSRRSAVHDAITKGGSTQPEKIWERVASLIDAHASRWVAEYRDACQATHVRGEQSAELLDLRMSCLGDDLESTSALIDVLVRGDQAVAEHAVEATGALPDLGRCRNSEQLRSVRPPKDPMLRSAVADLRRVLKEGTALYDAGQFARAERAANKVLGRKEADAYCPLKAEALLLKANSHSNSDFPGGRAVIEQALVTAEACGHDRVVATAAAQLVYLVGRTDWGMADLLAGLSAAALRHLGGDVRIEGWLANNLGVVRMCQGRWQDAQSQFELAVRLKEQVLGSDHLDVAESISNLATALSKLGRVAEALEMGDHALAIARRWAPTGTPLGYDLYNRGEYLLALGRLGEAKESFEQARTLLLNTLSPNDPDLAGPVMGLGSVALRAGNLPEAISSLQQALSAREGRDISIEDLAENQFRLAVALDLAHRDGGRARALATKALANYSSQPGFDAKRREVQEWLDARQPHFVAAKDRRKLDR